ncbi:MAG: GrpB family protein [Saprospiraceae bacterium]|nr:GrpB family protein [Saprospiraceae bacterium]
MKRKTVTLIPYTSRWSEAFELFNQTMSMACRDHEVIIEHIGSTAVRGLSAKPVIDVAVGVPPGENRKSVIAAMTQLGCLDRGDRGDRGGHLMVMETETDVVSHHIHVLCLSDPQ